MKLLRIILVTLLVMLVFLFTWSAIGRVGDALLPGSGENAGITIEKYSSDTTAGANIIGMQPYLTAKNYANEASFWQVLDQYMAEAKKQGLLSGKTIVVFPEYIGSWLVALEEKYAVYDSSSTVTEALTVQVISNLGKFIPAYFNSNSADRTKEALFRMKQDKMCRVYQDVFSRLAKKYAVTIVAGSVVLASPEISPAGELVPGTGKLYNTSVVFDPAGQIMPPLVKKIFPISDELGFTCAADTQQSPVFVTPAGRLAVLVCADSWFPAAYQNLKNKADVIAIPSLGGADSIWTSPWNGYNGFPPPADVDTTLDYHRITEGDAWAKHAMAKRAPETGIHYGMNVFFTGKLWDMKPEGRVLVLDNDSLHISTPAIGQGRISSLWFKPN